MQSRGSEGAKFDVEIIAEPVVEFFGLHVFLFFIRKLFLEVANSTRRRKSDQSQLADEEVVSGQSQVTGREESRVQWFFTRFICSGAL